MNEFPRMLYKLGGEVALQDGNYSTLIVGDAIALKSAIDADWHLTPAEAKEAADVAPVAEVAPVKPAAPKKKA